MIKPVTVHGNIIDKFMFWQGGRHPVCEYYNAIAPVSESFREAFGYGLQASQYRAI